MPEGYLRAAAQSFLKGVTEQVPEALEQVADLFFGRVVHQVTAAGASLADYQVPDTISAS
jgi:hypothetical protein